MNKDTLQGDESSSSQGEPQSDDKTKIQTTPKSDDRTKIPGAPDLDQDKPKKDYSQPNLQIEQHSTISTIIFESVETLGEEESGGISISKSQDDDELLKCSSWSHPDFKTDWSDFEITTVPVEDESALKFDATDLYYPGMSLEDVKIRTNDTHGFTLVETVETDAKGNKRNVRKFFPRIRQKIKTYRKPVPIKVTFTKLINDVDLVEEEEDVNEEMEVDEIINTCLVKKKDKIGETILEEKEIVQEVIKYVGKKKKFMKLKMINDLGETVDELIELNDDAKRTNDIMKSAAPYLKKKTKETPPPMEDKSDGQDSQPSIVGPEWYKAKDTQKDLIKLRAVEQLKQARDEQRALKDLNRYLGKKLCEYYDLKGAKDPNFSYDESGNTEEEKQKYQKRLLEFNDVINFIFNENKKRADMISKAERDTQRDAEELKKEKHNYYGLEEAMLKDIDPAEESKTLRSMTFAELLNQQKHMDSSLAKVRLECIRSEITLKDLEEKKEAHQNAIANMEKVDFISFESLRFKTKDLNDKLDLKEKQVLAMKDRLTQRVQALAHVRLKSDHLTVENEKLRTETKDIVEELDALRKECLLVQIERRKLEKQLSKVKSKEGIQKYPYLIPEIDIVEAKGEEQLELLGQLVNTCTELKSQMEEKLEDHRIGVEKYQRIQEDKKQKKKLFSFEFK